MPKTVRWRGIDVDPDTADMLTAIAKAAGDDIYVQGIPGYGSYRANAASGGTDTGGGHADLNMVGYSEEQCRRLETVARSKGACAYWRPERRPDGTRYGWQNHVHILRMDCPDLSPAARAQVADYLAGYDGLYYGPGVKRKDTGTRSYTSRRWLTLSAALGGPVLSKPVATLPKPSNPAPATVPKEDDMPSLNEIAAAVWTGKESDRIPAPKANIKADPSNPNWTPSSYLYYTYASLQDARAEIAGLTAAVRALAESHGASGDAVVEAVRGEVAKAMQDIEITLTPKSGA